MEIDKLIEGADIVRFMKAQRIKWLGHIQRINQARPTRKLLDWKPMGIRPVGRLRQRQEDVMEDLKKLKVKNWKEKDKVRRTWRGEGENPERVIVPNDDDDEKRVIHIHKDTKSQTGRRKMYFM
jgi:hypothetical protein